MQLMPSTGTRLLCAHAAQKQSVPSCIQPCNFCHHVSIKSLGKGDFVLSMLHALVDDSMCHTREAFILVVQEQ